MVLGKTAKRFYTAAGAGFFVLAALAGTPYPAAAQSLEPGLAPPNKVAASAEDEKILLQADELNYDRDTQTVTAQGHVEVAFGDRVLTADRLTYNQLTGVVTADGDVALFEPEGDIGFAEHVVLSDELREGVIDTLSMLMADDSRLVGARAKRTGGNVTTLYRGVYSPCDICKEEGKGTPLWQIKAFKVIHNKKEQRIIYEDAFMEFFGVPIAYVPFFSHPDPTVKRQSGFLTPGFGNSTDLGAQVEVPYYWAIAPNIDLTIAPRYTSNQGMVYKGQIRHRIEQGTYQLDVTGTQPTNDALGDEDFRGSLFGEGAFQLSRGWSAGFQAQLTTDDTYLRRYDLSSETDLTSNINATYENGRNRLTANAYYFQGLLATDDPDTTPFIAPLINYDHALDQPVFGGRVRFNGNGMVLGRADGAESRRLIAAAEWERPRTLQSGQIYRPFASLRGDFYLTDEVPNPVLPSQAYGSETIVRALPTAGVEWRWPFVRAGTSTQQIIEPIVQLVYSPDIGNPSEIPNEDSLSFEFDDTNLFSDNRFPGYDRIESGGRTNIGLRYAIYDDDLGAASVLVGQVLRLKEDDAFDPTSGLADQQSDYVGRIAIAPSDDFLLVHRFRIDRENFDFKRNEIDLSARYGPLSVTTGYGFFDQSLSQTLETREEIYVWGRLAVTDEWSVTGSTRRDLEIGQPVTNTVGIGYEDECFALDLSFRQDFTRDRDIEPDNSIFLQFSLKNLGGAAFASSLNRQ